MDFVDASIDSLVMALTVASQMRSSILSGTFWTLEFVERFEVIWSSAAA
jgi:hypothetical protein